MVATGEENEDDKAEKVEKTDEAEPTGLGLQERWRRFRAAAISERATTIGVVLQLLLSLWALAALWPAVIETTAELSAKESNRAAATDGLAEANAAAIATAVLTPVEDQLTEVALKVPDVGAPETNLDDKKQRAELVKDLDELKETLDATSDEIKSTEDIVSPTDGSGSTAVDATGSVGGAQENLDDAVKRIDKVKEDLLDEKGWTEDDASSVEADLALVVVAVEGASSDLDDATAASSVDVGQNRIEDAAEVVRDLQEVLADDEATDAEKLEQVDVLEATLLKADEQLDAIGDDISVPDTARQAAGQATVTESLDGVVAIRQALEEEKAASEETKPNNEDTPDEQQPDNALDALGKVQASLAAVDEHLGEANSIITTAEAEKAEEELREQGVEAAALIREASKPGTGRAIMSLHPFARFNHRFDIGKDMILFFVAMAAGVLGGTLMSLIRFTSPDASKTGQGEDLDWTRFRGLIGGGLALVVYFLMRGGLFDIGPTTSNLNPYTIAAIAAITGMYSTPITKRLGRFAGLISEDEAIQPAAGQPSEPAPSSSPSQ